ncbi:glycoside hydrolase family 3 N-terminal domain-containing protein [Clostridium oryzae]|uniref:Periplasmic beta-glucosidase n=1 Tax=Clostridium oryzae TaxID=1450648 RepID=A0A1V4IXG2_9CLOT|nr:glycoside hydrolase family 3 N-terminal domain-containing protein [Clostridium oryzae]OPJ64599.1 periplasmic beta-glucosidase precursor [Clostridium oryzae]
MEKYKDINCSVEERVEDLLSRMTLKEKVGQLNQKLYGWEAYIKTENGFEVSEAFKEEVNIGDGLGALYGLFRADPWSKVNFNNGIPLSDNAKVANMLQKYVIENTRLGIPIFVSEECPHGHQALNGTMFPTNIGIGSAWNTELYEKVFSQVAAEIKSRGGSLALVSTLDIMQDPRWGRAEECYGEDPYLAAQLAASAVKGLQGHSTDDLKRNDKLAAVVKHLCAQGASVGGHNGKGAPLGERELREVHIPAMKSAVEAGVEGCMAAYNEIDGIYCHANKKLLTDILRNEWNFQGIVMSDGCAVDNLVNIAGSYEGAAAMALKAGVDLNLWNVAFTKLEKAVKEGKVSEEYIDRAVRRVLRLKFVTGLFDNPFVDETLAEKVVDNEYSRKLNLDMARESIVLLKNENNILPLKKELSKVAVIGPNADYIYSQLGDYTAPQLNGTGSTVLQGVRMVVGDETEVTYAKGCGIRDTSTEGFAEAIEKAKASDAVILVLGGSSARDFGVKFDMNGAAILDGQVGEMDCGEGVDVADLELGGVQVELAKEIIKTGKPVIVVLIQGRPYSIPWIAENADGIICAWYPGKEGGQAVADVIFGNYNPSGKLSVSIPKASAQLPVYYNYKDTSDYLDMTSSPQYSFGYGMSYTKFELTNLRLERDKISLKEINNGNTVKVSIDVKNTGRVPGAEVVQLYIQDLEASITRRVKELKGFKKIWLESGEAKTVTMELGKEELSIWNVDMQFIVEPGNVKIMVGNSSANTQDTILIIEE